MAISEFGAHLNKMVLFAGAMILLLFAGPALAQQEIKGERYVPGIWVDPDGCEHWVMDDGFEGYMTPHVTRDGKPVCRRGKTCGVFDGDQLFATSRHKIGAAGRTKLENFFRDTGAIAYMITGHTDSRGSDRANIRLSQRRANAVAAIARSVGARVGSVRAYGERAPTASNSTTEGMRLNRRVEITCLQ